ncbi:MAG: hypothetical protein ACRD88_19930, partial [Terriglobia bacterium]
MTRLIISIAALASLAALLVWGVLRSPLPVTRNPAASSGKPTKASLEAAYRKMPLVFEVNRGQSDAQVKFVSRAGGYTMLLASTETIVSMAGRRTPVRMKLLGANPTPRVEGMEELPGRSNYFIGSNPTKWRTQVPQYGKVRY